MLEKASGIAGHLASRLSRFSPLSSDQNWTEQDLQGFLRAQSLALRTAEEIGRLLQPGWSEIQAARVFESALRDHGVKAFFHRPFVWFGDRTRFQGIQAYQDFMPTQRRVRDGDSVILDAAPIVNGFACDIGYTTSMGESETVQEAKKFLMDLRGQIPTLFVDGRKGQDIWRQVDETITRAGYQNCHQMYPLGVLGHRLYKLSSRLPSVQLLRFGWQSFAGLLQHGVVTEVLANFSSGDIKGLWAIEPHIGKGSVGAKFEEILVVKQDSAFWLSDLEQR